LWDSYQQFISFTSERVRCYTQMTGVGVDGGKLTNHLPPHPLPQTTTKQSTTSRVCAPARPLISGFFLRQKPVYTGTTATIVSDSAGVYSAIRTYYMSMMILSSPADAMTFHPEKERKTFSNTWAEPHFIRTRHAIRPRATMSVV